MPAVLEAPPSSAPSVQPDEPIVRVLRLDWAAFIEKGDDIELEEMETAYYALKREPDRAWAQAFEQQREWLASNPNSCVTTSIEEMPLEEWVGACLGDPEDAS